MCGVAHRLLARAGQRTSALTRAALLGAATPFLPCGLLYGMFLAALASGSALTGFAQGSWTVIVCLALGPQLLGHVGFNYAVGRMSAAIVAALILLEPVGASIVAAFVLRELPRGQDLLGGAVTLIGVAIAVVPTRARTEPGRG